MKLEQIKLIDMEVRIKYLLPVLLMANDFEEVAVDQDQLREFHLFQNNEVHCFTFVINGAERYYIFYCEVDGKVKFTRAKEGLLGELLRTVNPRDFQYDLFDTPLNNRFNVCGKLVVTYLNNQARSDIDKFVAEYTDGTLDYTIGHNVTTFYRFSMSYNAEFALHVKHEEGKYREYRGFFIRSKFNNIVVAETNEPINFHQIFGT